MTITFLLEQTERYAHTTYCDFHRPEAHDLGGYCHVSDVDAGIAVSAHYQLRPDGTVFQTEWTEHTTFPRPSAMPYQKPCAALAADSCHCGGTSSARETHADVFALLSSLATHLEYLRTTIPEEGS